MTLREPEAPFTNTRLRRLPTTYYFPTLNKVQNIYSKLLIFQKYLSLLYSRYCVNGELGLGYLPQNPTAILSGAIEWLPNGEA